jgi:hypothetical protein
LASIGSKWKIVTLIYIKTVFNLDRDKNDKTKPNQIKTKTTRRNGNGNNSSTRASLTHNNLPQNLGQSK